MKKFCSKFSVFALAALLLASSSACNMKKTIAAAEISKDYTRNTTETGEITDTFKDRFNQFALSLFKNTITNDNNNELLSPLSAALCLALVNNGAAGNTQTQIENLFGMDTNTLNRSLYAYTSSLYSSDDCKVNVANSIWFKDSALNVKPDFLQTNANWYSAQAYASPFDSTTIQDINNWCYNNTDGKIKKILNEIPPQAVMYLINALDFDAKWEKKYERKDVENGIFHNQDGTETDVKMLYSEENGYLLSEDAVGFMKSYKDRKYSFVGILPNEEIDIYEYAENLNLEKWNELWANTDASKETYVPRDVYARMPEFTYETELSLKETLQALGVTDMFSTNADFSGIDETQPLYCETVKQKAFIQNDRNGTKAAAITWAGMKAMSAAPAEPLYITLDRPFIYAIVDNKNDLPLFLGMVTNL